MPGRADQRRPESAALATTASASSVIRGRSRITTSAVGVPGRISSTVGTAATTRVRMQSMVCFAKPARVIA